MTPAACESDLDPNDGSLPGWVRSGVEHRRLGIYLHVPFCKVRCGYCDFNTYTASDLGGGASQLSYASTAISEVELAARVLDRVGLPAREISTVFVGGGTPTLLPAEDLVAMLDAIRSAWGLAANAEVTTEANPDSVTPKSLAKLADAGFTRISFGMQSAVPHVLATLERTHDPRRIPDVVRWARDVGLDVSLDLIYGTPGESLDDWRASVETALETGVNHVSAYALVVEQGTKMAAQVRRGALALPSEDDQVVKYELADELLSAAGLGWYEVSNWAREVDGGQQVCRHNLAYWHGDDWWGIGPGAHSHFGSDEPGTRGVRWWNAKHPARYAALLAEGLSPAAGREFLDDASAQLEKVMLGLRLREGLALSELSERGRLAVAKHVAAELLDGRAALAGRLVLTRRGRLLADTVIRDLSD